jgi:hypothetical protein
MLIRIQAQELAYDFHRQNLTVSQLWGKTPLAQAVIPDQAIQVFFYPAK